MTLTVSCGHSHKGLVRSLNEDASLLLPDYGVWAIADGMGGHASGDVASQIVVETLEEIVVNDSVIKPDVIEQALVLANTRVVRHYEECAEGETGGSTVVVLLVSEGRYHVFWLGDSRLYLYRQDRLTQLTRDHSQVNELVEKGIILQEDAEKHELANVITRAVGVEGGINIDRVSGDVNEQDVFLLCSDGLNKEVSDLEIKRLLGNADLDATNKALIHLSLVAGARDNVTSILVKIVRDASDERKLSHLKETNDDKTVPKGIKQLKSQ